MLHVKVVMTKVWVTLRDHLILLSFLLVSVDGAKMLLLMIFHGVTPALLF